MQPSPSSRTRQPDAGAFSRNSYPPSFFSDVRHGERGGGVPDLLAAGQTPEEAGGRDGTLDEVARREREDMRPRLRDELGREPTEEELDEWLRRHTEGH